MKLSKESVNKEFGRAIARGMEDIRTQKKSEKASRAERYKQDVRNAAETEMFK